jgi:hypothetical protein
MRFKCTGCIFGWFIFSQFPFAWCCLTVNEKMWLSDIGTSNRGEINHCVILLSKMHMHSKMMTVFVECLRLDLENHSKCPAIQKQHQQHSLKLGGTNYNCKWVPGTAPYWKACTRWEFDFAGIFQKTGLHITKFGL